MTTCSIIYNLCTDVSATSSHAYNCCGWYNKHDRSRNNNDGRTQAATYANGVGHVLWREFSGYVLSARISVFGLAFINHQMVAFY